MKLVELTEEYLKPTWEARNDNDVRNTSTSDKEVTWGEFEAIFKYSNYPKFVFIYNDLPMGYVEFRPSIKYDDPKIREWSFFIFPEHRGRGWSEIMLDLAIDQAKQNGYIKLIAIVKSDNEISIHLHEKLNFTLEDVLKDEIIYTTNL